MSLLDTFFNPDVIMSSLPALLRGFLNTLLLGILSIGIGIPIGLGISLLRLYAPKPLRWLAVGYTDIFRALPVLVVLILIYYALPFLGIRLSSWTSAVTIWSGRNDPRVTMTWCRRGLPAAYRIIRWTTASDPSAP